VEAPVAAVRAVAAVAAAGAVAAVVEAASSNGISHNKKELMVSVLSDNLKCSP